MQEKGKAIAKAAVPTTTTEFKFFLSLLSYYGKFIPNLSTIIAPMGYCRKMGVVNITPS